MNVLRTGAISLLFPLGAALAAPPDTDVIPAAPHFDRLTQQDKSTSAAGTFISVNNAQLAEQPELATALLDQAVREGKWPMVEAILPVYEASASADPTLIRFAKAGLARSKGDYDQAIAHYRAILSEHPELDAVRLDMARAMFENHQYDTAEYQFRRVLQSNPPENIQAIIGVYIERIQQGSDLTGRLSVSYLNDSNVNNASTSKTIRIGDRLFLRNKDSFPQRGEGFWFNGALQKDVSLYNQHGLRFMGTVNGKSYWNNHDFDDITSRLYAGYQWRDYRQQFALLPFYEKRWYGTEAYSSGPGVRAEYSYLLSPAWQISQALEYQKLHYDADEYGFLRGYSRYSSTTLSHAFSNLVSAYAGVDIQDQQTAAKSETNQRTGVRGGVQVDLPWQISFSASTAFAKRHYQADSEIFSTRRKDNEQYYNLSLWHRDLYVFGVMPKLNFSYKRVDSNINFYDYHQRNITLSLDKNF
ncbi:porin family protein [Enterobacter sp.]|uniref:porin family protein n=1 Tax=Enterobacter sp. TaxID=42895 RepID=UPI0029700B1C|nr:porin family protein [Enterobacter sp.]